MKATLIAPFVSMFLVGCVREQITYYYDNGQKKYKRTWKGQELDGPFIVWNQKGKEIRRENNKDG